MARNVKSRSHRKSKQAAESNAREPRALDAVRMRRYLAFVRAVVGVTTKGTGR